LQAHEKEREQVHKAAQEEWKQQEAMLQADACASASVWEQDKCELQQQLETSEKSRVDGQCALTRAYEQLERLQQQQLEAERMLVTTEQSWKQRLETCNAEHMATQQQAIQTLSEKEKEWTLRLEMAVQQLQDDQKAVVEEQTRKKELVERRYHQQAAQFDQQTVAMERMRQDKERLDQHVRTTEQQLMHSQDVNIQAPVYHETTWSSLLASPSTLCDFLGHWELCAARLRTTLRLCSENTRALEQSEATTDNREASLLSTAAALIQRTQQWQVEFTMHSLGLTVRSFRRHVIERLAQWSRVDVDARELPRPVFGVASHEMTMILQNWTRDQHQQQYVTQWLARVVNETCKEGERLELHAMTYAIKQAFLMLVVPMLLQSTQHHVHVWTRRVANVKASLSMDDPCWEMRLVVHQRPVSSHVVLVSPSREEWTNVSIARDQEPPPPARINTLQRIQAQLERLHSR
jgi:hypothetical protein